MPARRAGAGFTLVELLVVIGIIALLIAILLPVLSAARRDAKDVQCASNVRQLCLALLQYAGDWKGRFPPSGDYGDDSGQHLAVWWTDQERIGPYISAAAYYENDGKPVTSWDTSGLAARGAMGGVFVCPNDDGAARSYSMNRHASSDYNSQITSYWNWGDYFHGPNVRENWKVILVTETFSVMPTPYGYASIPDCGPVSVITPAYAFGAFPPISSDSGRFWGTGARYKLTPTEISYMNHRRSDDGGVGTQAKGRLN